MKIRYELNPPKLLDGDNFNYSKIIKDFTLLEKKVNELKDVVDGIHITDSVLGIPRVSSMFAIKHLNDVISDLDFSMSIRTCDRNIVSISQLIFEAIHNKVTGILFVKGDPSVFGNHDTTLNPTYVIQFAKERKLDKLIQLDLSFPSKLDVNKNTIRKVKAKPSSFITQTISSLSDLTQIVEFAKKYDIRTIPCIMVPSEKNAHSARSIGLDWSGYVNNPIDFVKEAGKIAKEILLTSPNSFSDGINFLKQL